MQSLGTRKRGDAFSFTATIIDNATSAPLTGATAYLRCQGRHYLTHACLTELDITETDVAGTYLFTAPNTTAWEADVKILFDIEYTDGGVVSSTETFSVDIEADITHE